MTTQVQFDPAVGAATLAAWGQFPSGDTVRQPAPFTGQAILSAMINAEWLGVEQGGFPSITDPSTGEKSIILSNVGGSKDALSRAPKDVADLYLAVQGAARRIHDAATNAAQVSLPPAGRKSIGALPVHVQLPPVRRAPSPVRVSFPPVRAPAPLPPVQVPPRNWLPPVRVGGPAPVLGGGAGITPLPPVYAGGGVPDPMPVLSGQSLGDGGESAIAPSPEIVPLIIIGVVALAAVIAGAYVLVHNHDIEVQSDHLIRMHAIDEAVKAARSGKPLDSGTRSLIQGLIGDGKAALGLGVPWWMWAGGGVVLVGGGYYAARRLGWVGRRKR